MTDDELQHMLVLDGAPGPALAIDAAHADAIVEAALVGAGFGPGGGGNGSQSGGSGGANGSGSAAGSSSAAGGTMAMGTKVAIVAVAALVVVALALLAWRGRSGGSEQLATPPVDAAVDSAESGTGSPSQAASSDPAPTAPSPDDPPRDARTNPATTDSPADDSPIDAESPRDDARSDPPRRAKPSREPSRADEAADLLGEANAKRAAKQWRESDALYARVVRLAPKSLAAQTALVASASLHLEHLGDPKGATQRFRRALALAPTGALAEDARWGLVEAARASKDRAGEASALDDFLAHHPRSPLASRAKARRAELP